MAATRWPRAFSAPGWAFEVKWDGVRAIASWDGDKLVIRSRRGRDITPTYPDLRWSGSGPPAILDGEIVALDAAGRPSFGQLQQRMNLRRGAPAAADIPVSFMVFDLLYLESPLIGEPWKERRRQLETLALPPPYVVPDLVMEDGETLWEAIRQQELEGMVAKRVESPYLPGARSRDWRKVSRVEQVRAVVGGFTAGEGSRTDTFGSMLLGLTDGDRLRHIGSVGTGFDHSTLHAIRQALDQMVIARSPFHDDSEIPVDATFVDPQLVAMVEFKEWTRAGKLRAPSFKGFADDPPEAATWQEEGPPTPRTESG